MVHYRKHRDHLAPQVHVGYIVCPPGPEQLQADEAVHPNGAGWDYQHQIAADHVQQLPAAVVVEVKRLQQLG